MGDTFALHLPFQLPESRDIADLPHLCKLGPFSSEIKSLSPYLVVEVRGIPSDEQARHLFEELADALHWAALDNGTGIRYGGKLSEIARPDDALEAAHHLKTTLGLDRQRVDGFVDNGAAYVRREADELVKITSHPGRARLSYNPEMFVGSLDKGLALVRSAGPIAGNLRLACEVYTQTHFLASGFVRFLGLFIPLEIAAPDDLPSSNDTLVKHVDHWVQEITAELKACSANSPQEKELRELKSRIGNLKRESHTKRITHFVRSKLEQAGNSDAAKHADSIRDLYGTRGKLTHEGTGEVDRDLPRLEEIVCLTLKAAIEHRGA